MMEDTVSVSRSVLLPAPSRDVWGVIGGFQKIHRWHPAVVECIPEKVGDHEFRHLNLADGGMLLEELLREGPHTYHYRIVRGALPVAHYEAKLEVNARGEGAEVTWSSFFTPTEPGAESIVANVYEAGFAALRERFAA